MKQPALHRRQGPARAQRGNLLVGMIMLLLITLITVMVYRLSTIHTQVVNNEQLRTEGVSAANYALDIMLNSEVSTWDDNFAGTGRQVAVNLGNIDQSADNTTTSMAVTVANLECKRSRIIKNAELIKETGGVQYVSAEDSACFGGGATPLTIVDTSTTGSPSDNSLCANILYEAEATVSDPKLLEANLRVRQGVEVRRGVDALEDCD